MASWLICLDQKVPLLRRNLRQLPLVNEHNKKGSAEGNTKGLIKLSRLCQL